MLVPQRTTLTQYLIEQRRRYPAASGGFNSLVLDVAQACKGIARAVAAGSLAAGQGETVAPPVPERLDALANRHFLQATQWGGNLAGLVSDQQPEPYPIPEAYPHGRHLLLFDPLDGAPNIDVNVPVGSLFSVLRAPRGEQPARPEDFLQPGSRQVAAGYAIYGPATVLVLSVGEGVVGFTLDPALGDFILTHPTIRIPDRTGEFAIDASNSRFWEPPVRRYVDECLAGSGGPRERDFDMRWVASLVAEAHRILLRGGVFLCPRDEREPELPARLRLLYECNPIAFLVEQAGGLASTGEGPLLEVAPVTLHQRSGFVFGSRSEVERIEAYYREWLEQGDADLRQPPLFNLRGLFRTEA